MYSTAEYIWLDGSKPTQQLRSKTRVLEKSSKNPSPSDFPEWSLDGSSTYQAEGNNSDLTLKPVKVCKDPTKGENAFLVLCEVCLPDNSPHSSNTRHTLAALLEICQKEHDPWIGFEQEYTLFQENRPLGWPEKEDLPPQGPYYCGIGSRKTFGRDIMEDHMFACMNAEIPIFGTNAEVMPSQWEFQIGYRGFSGEEYNALDYSDFLWLSRWLLHRVAEDYDVVVSFDNKPLQGDWNGSGCHTNFSTNAIRNKKSGMQAIEKAIKLLSAKTKEHIDVYGADNDKRLTGQHETCSINEFHSGVGNRGASIRIPHAVAQNGYGYLEDRRPGANCAPYLVAARLIKTICEIK